MDDCGQLSTPLHITHITTYTDIKKKVLGLSNVCTTPDNAAYDMTVHAALRINKVGLSFEEGGRVRVSMCLCIYVWDQQGKG